VTAMVNKAGKVKGAAVLATFRDSPIAVKTIVAGVFINRLSGFLNIFLVLYLTSRGFSAGQASIALGSYGAGALVGVFIGGLLADRMGARNATVLSMASASVLTASLLFLPTYPLLLAAAVLVGLGGQLYRPAAATLLSELTPDDRQIMIFAMHRFGMNLGATAAPLVGLALFHFGGQSYNLLFWGEALIAICYAVLAWVRLPGRAALADRTARLHGSAPDAARRAASGAEPSAGGRYRVMLRDRRYLVFLVAALLHTAVYSQYLSTLPLDVVASGLPMLWYTLAVSLNGFIVIAFELLLTKATQRWPFKVTIGAAFALLGIGVAGYGLPIGPAVIIACTVIWSVGEIIGGPALFAYPAVVSPRHMRSQYISSFQLVFGLGAAIGPAAGGILFSHIGHRVWPVLALGSLVATLLVLVVVRNPAPSPDGAARDGAVPDSIVRDSIVPDSAALDLAASAELVGLTTAVGGPARDDAFEESG
jgi:MFS family permease